MKEMMLYFWLQRRFEGKLPLSGSPVTLIVRGFLGLSNTFLTAARAASLRSVKALKKLSVWLLMRDTFTLFRLLRGFCVAISLDRSSISISMVPGEPMPSFSIFASCPVVGFFFLSRCLVVGVEKKNEQKRSQRKRSRQGR